MHVDQALDEIAAVRLQMARSTHFRGYGPATLALTGALAVVVALVQARWLPDPKSMIVSYLLLWAGAAVGSVGLIGVEAIRRARQAHHGLADDMLAAAAEQLLPAATAGIMLTLVLQASAPETLWMLPGLWQIILSLGMFAASRSLPRPLILVPLWYLATGLSCLTFARGEFAMSPWSMGAPFALGQCLAAVLLWASYRGAHERT